MSIKTKTMNVYLYSVIEDAPKAFLNACMDASKMVGDTNVKPVNNYMTRIDQLDAKTGAKDGCYLMDFSRIQDMGPGATTSESDKPTEPIKLARKQKFSFLTAALYHQPSNHVLVEYNGQGAKPPHIAEYVSRCSGRSFEFRRHVDKDVVRLLSQEGKVKQIEYGVNLSQAPVDAKDKEAILPVNAAVGLANATNILGVGAMEINFKPLEDPLENFMPFLETVAADENTVKAVVRFKPPDTSMSVIDFLDGLRTKHAVEFEYDTTSKMYHFQNRCGALREALHRWQTQGIIK